MTGARTTRLRVCAAASSGSRAHGDAHDRDASRSAMPRPMRRCRAGSRAARCTRCSPRAARARRRPASSRGWRDGVPAAAAAAVGAAGFFAEIESGALSMSGLVPNSASIRAAGDGARAPTSTPRCAPPPTRWPAMRSAPSCWKSGARPAARSRRQPQADAGGAGLRRHRACCCGWRRSRSPRPRRRDGSCARRIRRRPRPGSAWGAPVFDAQLVRNRHGPVGRWIMEWKCDECLFREPAAYPQPVAAAPAHRPHQAPARARQRRAG